METSNQRTVLHLAFLDGLRGMAALYVVVYHACSFVVYRNNVFDFSGLPAPLRLLARYLSLGGWGVVIFIVLSGYCLMLPLARSERDHVDSNYWRRRAQRILPPYYIVLALSVVWCVLSVFLQRGSENLQRGVLAALDGPSLLAHALLIHNLFPQWQYGFDAPLWSVATEFQIYFVFPFLLLPVWRRFGILNSVLVGLSLGYALHYGLGGAIDSARPWFIGCFAMGMGAAIINFRQPLRLPWMPLCCALAISLAVEIKHPFLPLSVPISDFFVALATVCLLIGATQSIQEKKASLVRSLLEHRWAVGLGAFSYSLYLVHALVLEMLNMVMHPAEPTLHLTLMLMLGVPLSIMVGYGFYLAFERRCMPRHHRVDAIATIIEVTGRSVPITGDEVASDLGKQSI